MDTQRRMKQSLSSGSPGQGARPSSGQLGPGLPRGAQCDGLLCHFVCAWYGVRGLGGVSPNPQGGVSRRIMVVAGAEDSGGGGGPVGESSQYFMGKTNNP